MSPPNDMFADALPLIGNPGTLRWDSTGASIEQGEPYGAYNTFYGLWYRLELPAGGPWMYSLDTFGTNANTVMDVWKGPSVTKLDPLAWNLNHFESPHGYESKIKHGSFGGEVLHVRVGGYGVVVTTGVLNWSYVLYEKASFSTPYGADTSYAQAVFVPASVRHNPLQGPPQAPGVRFGPGGRSKPGESYPHVR